MRDRLNPGGTVSVNVGHVPGSDALEKVLTATMRASFGEGRVWRDPVDDTNTVLLAPRVTSTRPSGSARSRSRGGPAARRARPDRTQPGLRRRHGLHQRRGPGRVAHRPALPGRSCGVGAWGLGPLPPGSTMVVVEPDDLPDAEDLWWSWVVLAAVASGRAVTRPAGSSRTRSSSHSTAPTAPGCGCSAPTAAAPCSGAARRSLRESPPRRTPRRARLGTHGGHRGAPPHLPGLARPRRVGPQRAVRRGRDPPAPSAADRRPARRRAGALGSGDAGDARVVRQRRPPRGGRRAGAPGPRGRPEQRTRPGRLPSARPDPRPDARRLRDRPDADAAATRAGAVVADQRPRGALRVRRDGDARPDRPGPDQHPSWPPPRSAR